jgi:DNA invertase Pin-like site-specific DNA recombinase
VTCSQASSSLPLQPKLRAALYLRVSTGRQAENDLSIPDQKRQAETYCQAKGWAIVTEFVEPGASATDDRRPEFQRMMESATGKPQSFEVIVVHSFSRFFRDHFELEFHVRRLAKHGVRLVSITQELGDDPTSVMMRQIMALFDEYQSRENAKHTLRAMNENARQGFWNGSRPPFGYRVVDAEKRGQKIKKRLAVDPIQAETVRTIFSLYLEGDGQTGPMGIKSIVGALNAQGVRTPSGAKLSCKFIHDVLTRTAYIGTHRFNVTEAKTGRVKSDAETIEYATPPILDPVIFRDVQNRLKERNPRVTAPRLMAAPCLLTGIAVCADCGGGMTLRTGKGGQYRYYTCATQARQGKSACRGRSIRLDRLDSLVMEHLTDRMLQPGRMRDMLATLFDRYTDSQRAGTARVGSLRNAYREAEAKIQRLYAAIENGIADLSDSILKDRLAALKVQRDETKRLLDSAETPDTQIPELTPALIEDFTASLRTRLLEGPVAFRKEYLQSVVDRVEVGDTVIRLTGRKDRLVRQLMSGRPLPKKRVRFFGQEWRPQGEGALMRE